MAASATPADRRSNGGVMDVRVPLKTAPGVTARAPSWRAAVVAIGPRGEVSAAVHAHVAVDVAAPALSLPRPFLSAPWPFTSTLTGRAEPGAKVQLGDRQIPVSADGTFTITSQLVPWPQRLELRALDPTGNETVLTADVIGGVDYRRLPWAPILVATLLAATLVASLRSRRPDARVAAAGADHEPSNHIEEVVSGPGPTLRRVR